VPLGRSRPALRLPDRHAALRHGPQRGPAVAADQPGRRRLQVREPRRGLVPVHRHA